MPEIDLAALHPAIEPYIPLGRSGLLPALHAAQKVYGWISEPVAAEIAASLKIPLVDVHGVIEFYTLFYNEPVGRRIIRVCVDPACALKDGDAVLRHLCNHHGLEPGQTAADGSLTIESSPCLGLCEQAPAALVNDQAETNINLVANSFELGRPKSLVGGAIRLLTANCGHGTTSLAQHGEYAGLKRALSSSPKMSSPRSRPPASSVVVALPFPPASNGKARPKPPAPRSTSSATPTNPSLAHSRTVSCCSMIPTALLRACSSPAMPSAQARVTSICAANIPTSCRLSKLPSRRRWHPATSGENILNSGFSFDIEIRIGAGAYICGEETALFESIEGKRGFPRVKPPFPTTFGVFGKPTVINNVETLFNVPLIISQGVEEYRRIGTEKSPGPKLFCVSGDVAQPGVYEVPFGLSLRDLLDLAGGLADGKGLQAVLFGGAAGAFATAKHLDVRLTFEDLRAAGLPLGSGVVMVFNETRDLRDVLKRLGHFFAHESCGKCYPCQMGTQRQKEILDRIADGRILPGDLDRLQDIGWTMTDASLCGLGQTAAGAVMSAIQLWPALFTAPDAAPETASAPASSAPKAAASSKGRPATEDALTLKAPRKAPASKTKTDKKSSKR